MTAIKERPILFNAAMVRALLDGSKTQTRRAVKLPHQNPLGVWESFDWGGPNGGRTARGETVPFQRGIAHTRTGELILCPHGQPGERLWVRETWRGIVKISPPNETNEYGVARYVPDQEHCQRVEYAATQERDGEPWRPSHHLPRWASRITLEITAVRVERLQDISEADAEAEGINFLRSVPDVDETLTAKQLYEALWESINGKDSWTANPWVWVIEFKRRET